jgi:hypothetical protein
MAAGCAAASNVSFASVSALFNFFLMIANARPSWESRGHPLADPDGPGWSDYAAMS